MLRCSWDLHFCSSGSCLGFSLPVASEIAVKTRGRYKVMDVNVLVNMVTKPRCHLGMFCYFSHQMPCPYYSTLLCLVIEKWSWHTKRGYWAVCLSFLPLNGPSISDCCSGTYGLANWKEQGLPTFRFVFVRDFWKAVVSGVREEGFIMGVTTFESDPISMKPSQPRSKEVGNSLRLPFCISYPWLHLLLEFIFYRWLWVSLWLLRCRLVVEFWWCQRFLDVHIDFWHFPDRWHLFV